MTKNTTKASIPEVIEAAALVGEIILAAHVKHFNFIDDEDMLEEDLDYFLDPETNFYMTTVDSDESEAGPLKKPEGDLSYFLSPELYETYFTSGELCLVAVPLMNTTSDWSVIIGVADRSVGVGAVLTIPLSDPVSLKRLGEVAKANTFSPDDALGFGLPMQKIDITKNKRELSAAKVKLGHNRCRDILQALFITAAGQQLGCQFHTMDHL